MRPVNKHEIAPQNWQLKYAQDWLERITNSAVHQIDIQMADAFIRAAQDKWQFQSPENLRLYTIAVFLAGKED